MLRSAATTMMRVHVLGSGSSGNALLVEAKGTRVLVEAGIGPRIAAARLAELGVTVDPGSLDAIVATHEHGDHYRHATQLAAAFQAPLYIHAGITAPAIEPGAHGTETARGFASRAIQRYPIGRSFTIGALTVTAAQVPHDAMQVALRLDDGVRAFGIATDVGRPTHALVALLADCDAALVEANHCTEMLAFSEYPDVVKRRLRGGLGHLSNDQTAELAARLVGSRLARIWLGHLSRSNNSPVRALETVGARARRIEVAVLPDSTPLTLDVRTTRPHQLGLPFG